MRIRKTLIIAAISAAVFAICGAVARSEVLIEGIPIRVNLQFIVDDTGARPVFGRFNSDLEILNAVRDANSVLRAEGSEFRLEVVGGGVNDLTGVHGWFDLNSNRSSCTAPREEVGLACTSNADCDTAPGAGEGICGANGICLQPSFVDCDRNADCDSMADAGDGVCRFNRDRLRDAAEENSDYAWDPKAINIYFTGGRGGAVATFPPNNQMILMNQFGGVNTLLHEIGHNLSLLHTHEKFEQCPDTVKDFGCCGDTNAVTGFPLGILTAPVRMCSRVGDDVCTNSGRCTQPAGSAGAFCTEDAECDSSPGSEDGACGRDPGVCTAPTPATLVACNEHADCDSAMNAGDGACTIPSDCDWGLVSQDMLAAGTCNPPPNAFANASLELQARVDQTLRNVMSYHPLRDRFSLCQKDNATLAAYDSLDWMLSRQPVYIGRTEFRTCNLDDAPLGSCDNYIGNGSAEQPHRSLQDLLLFTQENPEFIDVFISDLRSKVLVLEASSDLTITGNSELLTLGDVSDFLANTPSESHTMSIISRSGPARVEGTKVTPGFGGYSPPIFSGDIDPPDGDEFEALQKMVRDLDKRALDAGDSARQKIETTTNPEEREKVEKRSRREQQRYAKEAIKLLKKAEKISGGNFKYIIQLEIGDRYREVADCKYARKYYSDVAEDATDLGVQAYAKQQDEACEEFLTNPPR